MQAAAGITVEQDKGRGLEWQEPTCEACLDQWVTRCLKNVHGQAASWEQTLPDQKWHCTQAWESRPPEQEVRLLGKDTALFGPVQSMVTPQPRALGDTLGLGVGRSRL